MRMHHGSARHLPIWLAFTFAVLFTGASVCSGQVADRAHTRYVLQRQDVVSVTFPLSPELNQTLTIQPDGYISLQNAGSLYAEGKTVPELVEAIRQAYQGVLHAPIINVDVTDFQKPFFTVSGQVGKPGQYDLRTDLHVSEAVAVAGGITTTTGKSQVFLFRRASKGWLSVQEVDLKKVVHGKDLSQDALLQPGDMLYVPEKFIANFRKYVPYTVNLGTYFQAPIQF